MADQEDGGSSLGDRVSHAVSSTVASLGIAATIATGTPNFSVVSDSGTVTPNGPVAGLVQSVADMESAQVDAERLGEAVGEATDVSGDVPYADHEGPPDGWEGDVDWAIEAADGDDGSDGDADGDGDGDGDADGDGDGGADGDGSDGGSGDSGGGWG